MMPLLQDAQCHDDSKENRQTQAIAHDRITIAHHETRHPHASHYLSCAGDRPSALLAWGLSLAACSAAILAQSSLLCCQVCSRAVTSVFPLV